MEQTEGWIYVVGGVIVRMTGNQRSDCEWGWNRGWTVGCHKSAFVLSFPNNRNVTEIKTGDKGKEDDEGREAKVDTDKDWMSVCSIYLSVLRFNILCGLNVFIFWMWREGPCLLCRLCVCVCTREHTHTEFTFTCLSTCVLFTVFVTSISHHRKPVSLIVSVNVLWRRQAADPRSFRECVSVLQSQFDVL